MLSKRVRADKRNIAKFCQGDREAEKGRQRRGQKRQRQRQRQRVSLTMLV